MSTDIIRDNVIEGLREDLAGVEEKVMTTHLSDLIRHGSTRTAKAENWGGGDQACALSAGAIDAVALGIISDEA